MVHFIEAADERIYSCKPQINDEGLLVEPTFVRFCCWVSFVSPLDTSSKM